MDEDYGHYLIRQPGNLKDSSISKLATWIVSQAPGNTEQLSRIIVDIQTYFYQKLPKMFYNNLAAAIIQASVQLSNEIADEEIDLHIGRMIETTFSEDVTSLLFGEEKINIFQMSLLKSNKLTNLVELKLTIASYVACGLITIDEATLIKILEGLPKIKYLSLHLWDESYDVDSIAECVAQNCKLVEKLDFGGSDCVTDTAIDVITSELHNIKSLNLIGTDVTEIGIEMVLLRCPDLVNLTGFGIDKALKRIATRDSDKRFKILSITPSENLELILKMCPLIQKCYFQFVPLEVFRDFQNLCDLEFSKYDFYDDQVNELIRARGSGITHLCFSSVKQLNLSTVASICEMCPNLESFTLKTCYFENEIETIDLDNKVFKSLKKLILRSECNSDLPCEAVLFLFLSKSPNVEFLEISGYIVLEDDLMLRVLDVNPLSCLKKLKIRNNISMSVIERIIQNRSTPLDVFIKVF